MIAGKQATALNERLGFFAHELRNQLCTATLALSIIKEGSVGLTGAIGGVLDRALVGLGNLIDRSLAEVRMTAGLQVQNRLFSLADFIAEIKLSATLEAQVKGCVFTVSDVDPLLAVDVDRDLPGSGCVFTIDLPRHFLPLIKRNRATGNSSQASVLVVNGSTTIHPGSTHVCREPRRRAWLKFIRLCTTLQLRLQGEDNREFTARSQTMNTDTHEPVPLRIDFVSDVVCPWCAIGLAALEQALQRTAGEVQAEIHFQPFELNPQMPAEGEDISEHLQRKYGLSEVQLVENQQHIRERGAELGFTFGIGARRRTYNTFDAHRLLHWAGLEGEGRQAALKHALLAAYFTDGKNVSDHAILLDLARTAGLPGERAQAILASDEFAAEVRADEERYRSNGINSVPAVIINQRHLISGGQPVELFERALRQIAQSNGQ